MVSLRLNRVTKKCFQGWGCPKQNGRTPRDLDGLATGPHGQSQGLLTNDASER